MARDEHAARRRAWPPLPAVDPMCPITSREVALGAAEREMIADLIASVETGTLPSGEPASVAAIIDEWADEFDWPQTEARGNFAVIREEIERELPAMVERVNCNETELFRLMAEDVRAKARRDTAVLVLELADAKPDADPREIVAEWLERDRG